MTINFFSADEKPYGCFCNFSLHGFELEGLWWHTSEHYYQAHKFAGTAHAETIRLAKTPAESAKLGHHLPHRSDWRKIKYDVMGRAVLCKFQTHADIRKLLLATGDEIIFVGAAPAVISKVKETTIISLPGVPRELKGIFEESLLPIIQEKFGNNFYLEKVAIVDSKDESVIAPILNAVAKKNRKFILSQEPKTLM